MKVKSFYVFFLKHTVLHMEKKEGVLCLKAVEGFCTEYVNNEFVRHLRNS